MITSLLSVALFFNNVYAVAFPAATPAPDFEKRQIALTALWSPVVTGTSVSYTSYRCATGSTLSQSAGKYWRCCPTAGQCTFRTACSAGTLYLGSTSLICSSGDAAATQCGAEYLYSTVGGQQSLENHFCGNPTDTLTLTYFVVSPTAAPTDTNLFPSSSSPSPSPPGPTPTPGSKTPIGAIVGGVVGGLAVIGLVVVAVFFLLKRRNKHTQPQQQPGMHAGAPGQPPPMQYDNKHASMMSAVPPSAVSPPPMYQNSAAQNQYAYGHSDIGQAPAGSPYSNEYKPPVASTSPVPSAPPMAGYAQQQQYGVPGPATRGAVEMPGHQPYSPGAAELPGH